MSGYVKTDPVEHLFAEHRRLHVMLQLARSAILHRGGPAHSSNPTDVLQFLQRIRKELANHFAEEEASNCLEKVTGHCPHLFAQVQRIRTEHPELLGAIDKLIAHVSDDRQLPEDRIAVEREFNCLCQQLHEHEAIENDLLRQGLAIVPSAPPDVPAVR